MVVRLIIDIVRHFPVNGLTGLVAQRVVFVCGHFSPAVRLLCHPPAVVVLPADCPGIRVNKLGAVAQIVVGQRQADAVHGDVGRLAMRAVSVGHRGVRVGGCLHVSPCVEGLSVCHAACRRGLSPVAVTVGGDGSGTRALAGFPAERVVCVCGGELPDSDLLRPAGYKSAVVEGGGCGGRYAVGTDSLHLYLTATAVVPGLHPRLPLGLLQHVIPFG